MVNNDKTYIGLSITSNIVFPETININDAHKALIDVEDYIADYVKNKYSAIVTGKGEYINTI